MENIMNTKYAVTRESIIVLNEADLVFAAQNGDFEAFNQLVLLFQDRIFALALRMLGDEDSAEDIAQNIFMIAYRSLSRFRKGSFRIWLYRITFNACYDELRRRKRRPVLSLEYQDEAEERLLPFYDLPGPSILPENEYERHELERIVQPALNRLDADQRAVVTLVDLQDLNYQEAAQILGVSVGTVKSRLARARLRLHHLLSTLYSIKQPL
jgi:RNA polymerase sigma factor (sigma-70 family)